MNASLIETPVEVVRKISRRQRETSTWDDVFKKVMDERNSEALRVAGGLEETNQYEATARKVSRWTFVLTLAMLMGQDLAEIVFDGQSFGFEIGTFLLDTLLYLIYGGMVYMLVLMGAYWFFILRDTGFPRLTNLIAIIRLNDLFPAIKLLLFISAFLVFVWVVDGYEKVVLVALLITLWLTTVAVANAIRPIRVLYIGVLTQDALTLIHRLQERLRPLKVVSCLTTGLVDSHAGIYIDGTNEFSTTEDLMKKIRKATGLPGMVVVDARYADTGGNELLNALQFSGYSDKPLILISDNKKIEMKEYPVHCRESGIDGLCVTENDLLNILKPGPWKVTNWTWSGGDGDGNA